jgi:hypothetical protein
MGATRDGGMEQASAPSPNLMNFCKQIKLKGKRKYTIY